MPDSTSPSLESSSQKQSPSLHMAIYDPSLGLIDALEVVIQEWSSLTQTATLLLIWVYNTGKKRAIPQRMTTV